MSGTRPAALFAVLLLTATSMAVVPAAAEASPSTPLLGMDANSAAALRDAGAPPAYASYWVGPWMMSTGWGHFDSALQRAKAAGATPIVYWYYWGDSISPSCVEHGCDGRSRAQWDAMTQTLVDHLRAQMQGAPVYVVIENEFNKNGITATSYAPTFDAHLAAKVEQLKAAPGVSVVLGFGAWGESEWGRFPKAIAASDSIGFQLMRASTKDSEASYRGAADRIGSLITRSREIAPTKGSFLYDLALSSYPDATYAKVQNETLSDILSRWNDYSSRGLQGIVYRELGDNPSMGTHNYYGIAEQYWGFRSTSGAWKPAWWTWKNAASLAGPTVPEPPGLALPADIEAEAMRASTGGRHADASASGGALWNLWTDGELSQRVEGDGAYVATVVARGTPAMGVFPRMQLRVDGAAVAEWEVPNGPLASYTAHVTLGPGSMLSIAFTNDARTSTEDRNLYVDMVRVARPPTNQAPVAHVSASTSGLAVVADGSASSDPDGDALAYAWDMGDGTTLTGARVEHAYAAAGTYTVRLVVDDGRATANASQEVLANRAPTAAFAVSGADLSWTFEASASSDPDGHALQYAWDMGDGTTASGVRVDHTYADAGARQVKLRVVDPMGAEALAERSVDATRPNRAPVAVIDSSGANDTWTFNATRSSDPDGDALSYAWTLPDGSTASGATITRKLAAGAQTVRLTVTDARGLSSQANATVRSVEPRFTADFVGLKGNDWWVQTGVSANKPVAAVCASVNGGACQPLAWRGWGWASSFHVPAGSLVTFRATATSGESVLSGAYRWPDATPVPKVTFTPYDGNQWWVQTKVETTATVRAVCATLDGGACKPLSYRSWGAWAASYSAPAGTKVVFHATLGDGTVVRSDTYTWPR